MILERIAENFLYKNFNFQLSNLMLLKRFLQNIPFSFGNIGSKYYLIYYFGLS